MSSDKTRGPKRAPSRFMTTKQVLETTKPASPVARTPIKRFDRKDVMERDLERYRAQARDRLLRKGFDIPPFLMPKPKVWDDEDGEATPTDPDETYTSQEPVLGGPKPAPVNRVAPNPAVAGHPAGGAAGVAAGTGQDLGKAPAGATSGGAAVAPASPAAWAAEQEAAIEAERSAYQEYLESLNGGATLLDHMQEGGLDTAASVAGRVDVLKEKQVRPSRVDLPEAAGNWAGQKGRIGQAAPGIKKKAGAGRGPKKRREPVAWEKALPRMAAYMIAAVAIGYILVLTVNEFSAILAR